MNTMPELVTEARRLSDLLDKGVSALRQAAVDYANAEHEYRKEHALAYLQTDGTVAEREAKTYGMVGELRRDRDIADGVRAAALEAVRARRTQLSALQSLLAAHRSEADFARTGPS
ncbi:MAG: hypothetical protein ACO4CZ_12415 [Planctomycetota bacterium]|jgi:hypothetical protein